MSERITGFSSNSPSSWVGNVIEDDGVTELTLVLHYEIHDVTPLMDFTKLRKLTLFNGPFWLDISVVNHLLLEELNCSDDITLKKALALKGM